VLEVAKLEGEWQQRIKEFKKRAQSQGPPPPLDVDDFELDIEAVLNLHREGVELMVWN
jgi:hypothetical protein